MRVHISCCIGNYSIKSDKRIIVRDKVLSIYSCWEILKLVPLLKIKRKLHFLSLFMSMFYLPCDKYISRTCRESFLHLFRTPFGHQPLWAEEIKLRTNFLAAGKWDFNESKMSGRSVNTKDWTKWFCVKILIWSSVQRLLTNSVEIFCCKIDFLHHLSLCCAVYTCSVFTP